MSAILDALEAVAADPFDQVWKVPAWKQFIVTGDNKYLKGLPKVASYQGIPFKLREALGLPQSMDEHGKRLLQACLAAGMEDGAGRWLMEVAEDEATAGAQLDEAIQVLRDLGCSTHSLVSLVVRRISPFMREDGSPTRAGQFLLGLADADLRKLLESLGSDDIEAAKVGRLLSAHDGTRFVTFLRQVLYDRNRRNFGTRFWKGLLERDPKVYLALAECALDQLDDVQGRFQLAVELEPINPAKYEPVVEKLCREVLAEPDTKAGFSRVEEAQKGKACLWLVSKRGVLALPDLNIFMVASLQKDRWERERQSEYKKEVLDAAVKHLDRESMPLLAACFETDQPEVQYHALQLVTGFKNDSDVVAVATLFRAAFGGTDFGTVARCIRLAGDWNLAATEPELWPLLDHKSRPVREAAAMSLAKLGESRLPKAKELWAARRADARLAAVTWLKSLGTPAAVTELKARRDVEADENVRDGLLLALESLGGATSSTSLDEIRERIQKTLAKLAGPPVAWLDPKRLPAAKLTDGTKLRSDWLLYLLYRQSRVKDMRTDLEAKPLYALIDRATSGDLALAVVHAYFGSKLEADDRWTLAFAALVGDDRLVPLLTRQIKDWADGMRGKLAEYAVQALALLGTDCALLAVDAMAIRYRSKNKNIGKAASEAFAAAAAARGLTVEELGDVVVPWLGFTPGQARIVDTGKAKIEVRINDEFKLAFRDAATHKKVAKLPDSAPADVKSEFKELAASLKEAVKSQLLRMENLMVRQFHWPVRRWEELYLRHPLLVPFAQRLVWGLYDQMGKPVATFRVLEDGSLTDVADEHLTLPTAGGVGIVHPLELSPQACQAWLKHLADYNVVPPFAQMERPVVTVKADQHDLKFGEDVAGTELNAMTFKGRAERLGWARGSVCDAGFIPCYLKRFPTAGVDVFVCTEGMAVGIDMYADITLGKLFFVKHGSVKVGSYEYDEPGDEQDPRLVPFGEVPAIAFSEAMGDLTRIAGKPGAPQPEESHA